MREVSRVLDYKGVFFFLSTSKWRASLLEKHKHRWRVNVFHVLREEGEEPQSED